MNALRTHIFHDQDQIFKALEDKVKAEIISIGTELLLGHVINTDAAYIARELAGLGIEVRHMQVVGDNPKRMEQAMQEALSRSDLVITSGGLGPTDDDLTKEIAAKVANLPLEENVECLESLREYFGQVPMSANQLKQTLMPRGAHIFKNPFGTAPGCAIPLKDGKHICILPGPPRELVPMLQNELLPFLSAFSKKIIKSAQLRCFGIGEGMAAEKLGNLVHMVNPTVATYAADGEMFVKISAMADSDAEAGKLIQPVIDKVEKLLGDVVYTRDRNSLEDLLVHILRKRGLEVACAESCTGGLLAKRITDQPGASEVFHLGVVSYANSAKERLLGVRKETLNRFGAVSPETAEEMARGIRELARADFGIGITGIAGPDGGSMEKPVGLVYLAIDCEKTSLAKIEPRGRYLGRAWVRNRAASAALDMLRRILLSLPLRDVY